jgi:hypothetical protein
MSNMFDDLFEKFFGRKPKPEEPKSEPEPISNDFVFKLLKSLKESDGFRTNFGPPTLVEYYEKDGIYFKRETWEVEGGGQMSHLIGSNQPFEDEPVVLTYGEQLAIALEEENYEEAARLRDKIKLINK